MAEHNGDFLAGIRRSSVAASKSRPTGRQVDGVPVYEFVKSPGSPSISVLRFCFDELASAHVAGRHAHAHDFLVLAYFEEGDGSFLIGEREWPVRAGDAFVIAPGEIVREGRHDPAAPPAGWCVFFPPEVIAFEALGWKSHPLLFPFVGSGARGAQRLPVPAGERATWSGHVAGIERELYHAPRDGSREAALAHLTLLLVGVARVAVDVGQGLRMRSEPLLANVFEFIEEHYREPISLSTVAAELALTPGHLTTVVRRRTGRSVQRWITERRMAEARRLLRETDLTVDAIAGRVGYRQTSYFIKHFRRDHATTPAAWRRGARAAAAPLLAVPAAG